MREATSFLHGREDVPESIPCVPQCLEFGKTRGLCFVWFGALQQKVLTRQLSQKFSTALPRRTVTSSIIDE